LCWNEYLFAAILAQDQAMTLPPWLASLKSFREAQIIAEEDELIHFSAGIVLTMLPLLAMTGLVLRFPERMSVGRRPRCARQAFSFRRQT
jgi:ABC-type glycerol-3-phosphate transport system permease component